MRAPVVCPYCGEAQEILTTPEGDCMCLSCDTWLDTQDAKTAIWINRALDRLETILDRHNAKRAHD